MVQPLISKGLRQPTAVKSATRVLQIFEHFEKVQRPLSLKEITRGLNYPQSSATVLLKSLLQLGYLNYNRKDRTYFPTAKLADLGRWLNQLVDAPVYSLIQRIQADTAETVMLAVQNDLYIQYVEVLDSQHEMRFHIERGSLIPLTETSLGWAILSTKPNDLVEAICRQINSRLSAEEKRIDVAGFISGLEAVRKQQYCYIRNLPMRGGGCVSMSLPTTIGGQSAAVGTGGLIDRLDDNLDAIVESMRRNIEEFVGAAK